jgi:hypothetical protein
MTENKYANGKIYKIISNETDKCYVGSTCQPLSQRMAGHRRDLLNYNNTKKGKYLTSFDILEYSDAKIILIELVKCTSKEELTKKEQFWIDQLDCVNKKNANGRNKIKDIERKKLWYEQNKELTLERTSKRYTEKREEILKYQKEYRENNKEKVAAAKKKCYESKKDEINAKRREEALKKRLAKKNIELV